MIGKVGKKGEIYVPKAVRNEINLNPGDEIVIEIRNKELIIRKKGEHNRCAYGRTNCKGFS